MPVTYGTFTKQLKLLPLTLSSDGGGSVTVRFGYVGEDGGFAATTEQTFVVTAADVSSILDNSPVPGLSRRDDLSFAVYSFLVSRGLVQAGSIS